MEKKKRQQLILNIFLVILGCICYYLASQFHVTKEPGRLGPNFWPQMLCIIIIFFSVIDIVISFLSKGNGNAEIKKEVPQDDEGELAEIPDKKYPLLLAGGMISTLVYIFLLPIIGFGIGTAIYLAGIMILGRYRNVKVIVSSSIIGAFTILLVFSKIVYISLPAGNGIFGDLTYLIYKIFAVN